MRISTSGIHQQGVNAILQQQIKLNETQMKLSSGKKILSPSEDPLMASRLIDVKQSIRETEQYQENIGTAKQRLSLEETGLTSVVDLLHRIRELGVQGLNDTYSAEDRLAIASELDQLNDQLLNIANSRNANGEYLFSGFLTDTAPFTKTAGSPNTYTYNGDANQRTLQVSPNQRLADGDPGESVFGTIGTDNLFETIETLSVAMKADNPQSSSLTAIDTALNRVLAVEASVGARLLTLERQQEHNAEYILDMEQVMSESEDLDYASAVSLFNQQTVSLQAAQQSFSRVQGLSLFNFL